MRIPEHPHRGWARRWAAGALGGALLLGILGARSVPPPPPLRWDGPRGRAERPPGPALPETPARVPADPSEGEPGVGPALLWLLPLAGQLSGAPNLGE